MGVTATFALLSSLSRDRQLPFAEAAIREPFVELQAPAFDALVDPARLNRPDIIVRHFNHLLPPLRTRISEHADALMRAARQEIRSGPDWARRAAYEVIAVIGRPEAVTLLTGGLHDESSVVRGAVADLLEDLGLRYFNHQTASAAPWEGPGDAYLKAHREAMLEALGLLLKDYPLHAKPVFMDIAIETGPEAYSLITEKVLAHGDASTCGAFVEAISTSRSEAAMDLLLRLWLEGSDPARDLAVQVMKTRRNASFLELMGITLSWQSRQRFLDMAGRVREISWWPAGETPPDLDRVAAAKLLDFLAASGLPAEDRGERIADFLRSDRGEIRAHAIGLLQATGFPGLLDAATRFLDDPVEEVRLAAARAVIRLDPPNKASLLAPLLESASPGLRRLAGAEVAAVGFSRYMESFDRLDPRTRELAARAVAKIDGRIMERLTDEIASLDPDRRVRALQIIDYVDAEEKLREPLLELLKDPDRRVRATAVRIVQFAANAQGRDLLVGALKDPDRRVRANAIEAMEDAGLSQYAGALEPFLADPDNRIRANAAKAMFSMGRPGAQGFLEAMLEDPDENMRLSAVWAVADLGYEGADRTLRARLPQEASLKVRQKIAEVLDRSKGG